MAINPLPQGLHNQYTEVLDSSPFLRRNLENEAKREAKEEALNQYFNDQIKTLNPAGLRDVHQAGILKEIADIQSFWNQNSREIKQGGEKRMQLDRMFRDAAYNINNAKQRDKFFLDLAQQRAEGKIELDEEDIKKVLPNLEKSIYDKSSLKQDGTDYTWADLSAMVKDLDIETEGKALDAITKNLTPVETKDLSRRVVDKQSGETITPIIKAYTPEQLLAAAETAKDLPLGNSELARKARKSYNRLLKDDAAITELEKYYKKVYGQDKEITTTEQVAQAKVIKRMVDATSEKLKEDKDVLQAQIKINVGGGSNTPKNAGANWVTRAMSAMKSGNSQTATDVFSELLAGDITKFDGVEDLGGGKFKVKILPKQKYDVFGQAIQGSTNPVERTFDVNSRTLPYELQNLYQSVMGGDVKLEKTYFPPNKPTGEKPKDEKPSGGSWKDRAKKVQ
jgi:hypothetical protein